MFLGAIFFANEQSDLWNTVLEVELTKDKFEGVTGFSFGVISLGFGAGLAGCAGVLVLGTLLISFGSGIKVVSALACTKS